MIKFHAKRKDGTGHVLGLALSRANCERLLAGRPILIRLESFRENGSDLPWRGDIVILAGETEAAIADQMMRHGVLENARVNISDPEKF